MNRCPASHRFRALCLALALGGALVTQDASAQTTAPQRIPPISAKAQRGVLRVLAPPEVLMDG
ncbi:MAG: hypothetical protein ABL896_07205, partial [Hylemonella sp.]